MKNLFSIFKRKPSVIEQRQWMLSVKGYYYTQKDIDWVFNSPKKERELRMWCFSRSRNDYDILFDVVTGLISPEEALEQERKQAAMRDKGRTLNRNR